MRCRRCRALSLLHVQDMIALDYAEVLMRPSVKNYVGWYDSCMQEAAYGGVWYSETTKLMVRTHCTNIPANTVAAHRTMCARAIMCVWLPLKWPSASV